MTDVSVIIPCYNLGQYINETINSVLDQTHQNFEIIVVNDGSTDKQTIEILNSINNPKIKVIHTSNQGLASARNNGIKEAQSKIILPLDSDDKIAPQYIEKALQVMNSDSEIGIVYCFAKLFGWRKGKWNFPEYSIKKFLFQNLIFHCAFFRREDWEKAKGYNPNMKYCYEDWDFWLSIISLGKKVFRIPEILHSYRIRKDSMWNTTANQKKAAMYLQLYLNHQDLYQIYLFEFFEEIHRMHFICERSIIDRLIHDKLCHPVQTCKNQIINLISKAIV